jgi:hypothetical protein
VTYSVNHSSSHRHLTTHSSHNIQTSLLPAGFEPEIPGSERPQTHILDRAATGIGKCVLKGLISLCGWMDGMSDAGLHINE